MLIVYLCGALIAAAATIGATIRFSDPSTPVTALTRMSVAILAAALWPLLAVGALQALGILLLARSRAAHPGVAEPRTSELMLAG
jgi:hypothetical protein